jgi:lipopolysaccharide heptosyltransferase II
MSAKPIDWASVERVLIVKLRSIGDTVLSTPSLTALRRFLPKAQIDILLENWVAPVLDGFNEIDNVISIGKGTSERLRVTSKLRTQRYDVGFNLHGGTTATFLTRASGARHRVGLENYQYSFLYNHLLSSPVDFWGRSDLHSAEQQLALLGSVGVPVNDPPRTHLAVTDEALTAVEKKLANASDILESHLALLHPSTAFFTKQWPVANFAETAEYLAGIGFRVVAISSKNENAVLHDLIARASVPITVFDDLSLPEITALASKASVFVGNDSGIAHIAAAVGTPSVVIFGSSNRVHWHPWTDAPNEMVFTPFDCQPCPGYECKVYGTPRCIIEVPPSAVFTALERVLSPPNS